MRKKVKKLLIQVVHKLFFCQCTYSTCILAMCVLNNKKENTSIMHKMICTFKTIVCPPSPMDHQAKHRTLKKKKALELGRTSVNMADPSMPWTHPPSSLFGGCLPIIPHGRGTPPHMGWWGWFFIKSPHEWRKGSSSNNSTHYSYAILHKCKLVICFCPHWFGAYPLEEYLCVHPFVVLAAY